MKMEIYTTCPFCGKDHFITVSFEDYERWQANLFKTPSPYLSANEREMLKTGICPSCWDKMFPPEEEDDEPEEFDYDFADTYCEIGFNPYLGAYDWDE